MVRCIPQMDSSVIEKDTCLGYESCIRVDGRPILPPLMSEARRHEMRQYREQAMQREMQRRSRQAQLPPTRKVVQVVVTSPPIPPIFRARVAESPHLTEPSVPQLFNNNEPSGFTGSTSSQAQIEKHPSPPGVQAEPPSPMQMTESPPAPPPPPQFKELESSSFEFKEPYPYPAKRGSGAEVPTTEALAPQFFKDSPPRSQFPPAQFLEPSPGQVREPSTVIDGPRTESDFKPSTPRGVRFFDDNPSGTPNVTVRSRRRRTRIPFFDDGGGDSESVANSDAHSDSWSSSTFVIETTQSLSVAHNSSFLSEGEVIDDSDEEYELDEAANLHLGKRGSFITHDPLSTDGYNRTVTPDFDSDTRAESIPVPISDDGNLPGASGTLNNNIDDLSRVPAPFKDDDVSTMSGVFKDDMSTVSAAFTNATSAGDSVFDSISNIGLSKLKSKMQTMSPSLFKIPGDTRSPLLKGVVFMDPLNRPLSVKRLPAEALDPRMKPKFDRVSACVKGYLVRRLLKTEKVNNLLQTIHDTVELILNLYAEGGAEQGSRGLSVKPGDLGLHARLIQQLNGACGAIHDICFKLSTPERMAIISTDRIKIRSKAMRDGANKTASGQKIISQATMRCMERRRTTAMHPPGPKRAKYQLDRARQPLHVPSHIIPTPMSMALGSQSVKSKQVKSFVVSPKRRRMTTFGKTSTPPYLAARGTTALSRMSQLDKSKSSSNPNMSKSRSGGGGAPSSRAEGRPRKKMDATFVKPNKGITRPLVSSNR